jgi:tagatose kinase
MTYLTTIGEILVEVMADTPGQGFTAPQPLTGPYPSGAPAIFAAQAALMGQKAALIASIGADDFGQMTLDRLAGLGVATQAIARHPSRPTGTAFVRYRPDGSRDFVFNIRHSAAGQLRLGSAAREVLGRTRHLHIMGSSLASPAVTRVILQAIALARAQGASLSFDPNLRPELLRRPGMAEAMREILGLCDIFLPSGGELTLLTEAKADEAALAELLARGPRIVVHKRGAEGASWHQAGLVLHQSAFPVTEVDPTGAGDCFGAALLAAWLAGRPPGHALRLAAAAGALAVTRRGPMEGAAGLEEVSALAFSASERLRSG